MEVQHEEEVVVYLVVQEGAAWVGVLWVEGQGASPEEDLEEGQVGDQVGVLVEAYEASVL